MSPVSSPSTKVLTFQLMRRILDVLSDLAMMLAESQHDEEELSWHFGTLGLLQSFYQLTA